MVFLWAISFFNKGQQGNIEYREIRRRVKLQKKHSYSDVHQTQKHIPMFLQKSLQVKKSKYLLLQVYEKERKFFDIKRHKEQWL